MCVPVYFLIAKPEKLGNELAAPAAVAWASVAKLLKDGAKNLPEFALHGIVIGVLAGIVLAVLEEIASRQHARSVQAFELEKANGRVASDEKAPPPPRWATFIPSATGLGIAFVIDFNDCFAMFVGAIAAWYLLRKHKETADRYTVSVASGIIARAARYVRISI